jgi:hypothetical protein
LTKYDLEDITKEWSVDLLVPIDPTEISDVDSLETMLDTLGPSKAKKDEEVQDANNTSIETTLISPEKGDDGGERGGIEVKKNKGEVTPPR